MGCPVLGGGPVAEHRWCYIFFMEVNSSLVLQLLTALRDCSRHVERGVREHELDAVDVGILAMAQASEGGLRPSRAAAALEVPFPSVTRHVQRLHREGYVAIQGEEKDRRSYVIRQTPSGSRLLRDFQDNLVSRFRPALAGWGSGEVQALADGLSRLASGMDAAVGRGARRPSRGDAVWWRETKDDGGSGEGEA